MQIKTIREQEAERAQKAYELLKFSFKHLAADETRTLVYRKVANEFGYKNIGSLSNIYFRLRALDKDPAPVSPLLPG